MASFSREELLALTPDRYCAAGYVGPDGGVRPEFRSTYATAAATQFVAAALSPQELGFTAEAVRQLLPHHDGSPGARAREAADEALATVAHMIAQPNNEGLATWLKACANTVGSEADLRFFLDHLLAVERLYALVAPLSQPDSPAESSPASPPPAR